MDVRQVSTVKQKEAIAITKDPLLSELVGKGHEEIDAWVDQNIKTIKDIQAILKRILYMVRPEAVGK